MDDLIHYVRRWADVRLLVVGDVMLDVYTQLRASGRRCPEADAPIFRVLAGSAAPGGAANVAVNARRLGARPILIGAIGSDAAGSGLRRMLEKADVDSRLVVASQPTTTKTRLVDRDGLVARLDHDQHSLTDSEDRILAAEITNTIHLLRPSAALLSDYSKGVLDPNGEAVSVLRRFNTTFDVLVLDPRSSLLGGRVPLDAITPNQREAAALGGTNRQRFFDTIPELQVVVETRGARGAIVRGRPGFSHPDEIIPTVAATRPHVCGAGDTFAAALTLARAADATWADAARIANAAAGIAVRHAGTHAPSADALVEVLMRGTV